MKINLTKEVIMVATDSISNSRIEELEFLISIMSDLITKYNGHNNSLLEELISNLSYRKDREETTSKSKFKSEEFSNKVSHNKTQRHHHHTA